MMRRQILGLCMAIMLGQISPISASVVADRTSPSHSPSIMPGASQDQAGEQTPAGQEQRIFRSISPAEAMRMLQSREDILFLDVRTPQERSQGAIPGSKLVSIYALLKGDIPLPKDKAILLVCAVGGRSYIAGQVLSQKGYPEVYSLRGGIQEWYQAGLPVVQDPAFTQQAAR